jgi:hypothetical protein
MGLHVLFGGWLYFLYADDVRTSHEAHVWTSATCYKDNFTYVFLISSRPALWPTQPAKQWLRGGGVWIPEGDKRLGRYAGHSPPPIAEIKKFGAISPLPNTLSRPTA